MSTQVAPKTSNEAAAFLKRQHVIDSRSWRGLCLSLQRQARGLPPVYPSALSAARATPASERITRLDGLRRGMVAFSDDPNDSNPYAHIYFIAGPRKGYLKSSADGWWTWTNDAKTTGGVDIVPLSFFKNEWGDSFMFGATWLNGYNFSEFDKPAVPDPDRAVLTDNFKHAIEDIRKELRHARQLGNPGLVRAMERDLAKLTKQLARFEG